MDLTKRTAIYKFITTFWNEILTQYFWTWAHDQYHITWTQFSFKTKCKDQLVQALSFAFFRSGDGEVLRIQIE